MSKTIFFLHRCSTLRGEVQQEIRLLFFEHIEVNHIFFNHVTYLESGVEYGKEIEQLDHIQVLSILTLQPQNTIKVTQI